MQNMNYYYDFSGQKYNHPLSLSMNSFDRKVFSRQTSLEISFVLRGSYEVVTEHISHVLREQELVVISPNEIHILKKIDPDSVILILHIDFDRIPDTLLGSCRNIFYTTICNLQNNRQLLFLLKEELRKLIVVLLQGNVNEGTDLFELNEIMMKILCITKKELSHSFEQLPVASTISKQFAILISTTMKISIYLISPRRFHSVIVILPDYLPSLPAFHL